MNTRIISRGTGGPVIICGMKRWQGDEFDSLAAHVDSLVPGKSFTLAFYEPDSWNDAFSPWKASCGGQDFNGDGPLTLEWIKDNYIPELESACPDASGFYIAGYSLSGLFSLWAMYECSKFKGCASCSGSLWFPGWGDYSSGHAPNIECAVYLSLGGKEKNSKDPVVSTIEDKTRAEEAKLRKQVREAKLEMNPGGHFSNPDFRLAKGIAWLVNGEKTSL